MIFEETNLIIPLIIYLGATITEALKLDEFFEEISPMVLSKKKILGMMVRPIFPTIYGYIFYYQFFGNSFQPVFAFLVGLVSRSIMLSIYKLKTKTKKPPKFEKKENLEDLSPQPVEIYRLNIPQQIFYKKSSPTTDNPEKFYSGTETIYDLNYFFNFKVDNNV